MSEAMALSLRKRPNPLVAFIAFILIGLAVFLPAMPYSAMIPDGPELIFRILLATVLAGLYYILKNRAGFEDWAVVFLGFAAATLGMALSWQKGGFLLDLFDGNLQTMRGIALAKSGSTVVTLLPIGLAAPLLMRGGVDFYLRLGKSGLIGLGVGAVAFLGFGFASFGTQVGTAEGLTVLQAALPWMLAFVLTNALMEEVLFRGLFLSKATALMGAPLAALATALVFAGAHLTVTYTADVPAFLGMLIALGLIWAALMHWSKSLWGSVVFHAGADLMILGGILQSMQ